MHPYADFVQLLQAFPSGEGVVELRAICPGRTQALRAFFPPGDTAAMTAWLAQRGPYVHGFFGPARRDGQGGGKAHLTTLPALWIDLDRPPAAPVLDPQPSVIVYSGRGEHWYWILSSSLHVDTPETQRAAEGLLRGLAARFGADSSSCDVSHLLRVPGTLNPKPDPPRRAEITRFDPKRRYHASDLFAYAAPRPAPPPRRVGHQPESAPRPPTGALAIMLAECGFLGWAARAPAEVSEPLWYAALTNLAALGEDEAAAQQISRGHPRYSPSETRAKLAHAQAFGHPHTCQTIAALGAAQCATCPWAGRARAPVSIPYKLARAAATATAGRRPGGPLR